MTPLWTKRRHSDSYNVLSSIGRTERQVCSGGVKEASGNRGVWKQGTRRLHVERQLSLVGRMRDTGLELDDGDRAIGVLDETVDRAADDQASVIVGVRGGVCWKAQRKRDFEQADAAVEQRAQIVAGGELAEECRGAMTGVLRLLGRHAFVRTQQPRGAGDQGVGRVLWRDARVKQTMHEATDERLLGVRARPAVIGPRGGGGRDRGFGAVRIVKRQAGGADASPGGVVWR